MSHDETIDETLPEVVKGFLRSGGTLERIRLRDTGEWRHEGMEFPNPRIVALFNRSVDRTPGGTWVLKVGQFTYPIEVEDTGFFVERVDLDTQPWTLHLSDETSEPLDASSLRYEPHGRLYCAIKGSSFQARFKRSAYYAVADQATEDSDGLVVLEIDGQRVALARLPDGT